MLDAFYAIAGAYLAWWALYNFHLWMTTGKLRLRPALYYPKVSWRDEPVQFAVAALFHTFGFVVGSWLLVSTLLKWLSFDSRYSL